MSTTRWVFTTAAAGLVSASLISIAATAQERTLVLGGGSTFVAPLMERWISLYEADHANVDLEYDSIGSGSGINRFLTGSLDFAATEVPLGAAGHTLADSNAIHVPLTSGMIAIAYHLPDDLQGDLRLPRDVYGDIFAGRITRWDDPRIQEANPDLALPGRTITVVARRDSSGTTYAFTNHLSTVSAGWREDERGASTLTDWPGSAILAPGNDGVAANIVRGYGTIGYLEAGYATRLGLPVAHLENSAGTFVAPTPEAGGAALADAPTADGEQVLIPDPKGAEAYPIVTFTWALLHREPVSANKEPLVRDFIGWAVTDGQATAGELSYLPLSGSVQANASTLVADLR